MAVVLGMRDIRRLLERWRLSVGDVRERMYRAATALERERWQALWLLAQGWTALVVSEALERVPASPTEGSDTGSARSPTDGLS